MKVSLEPTHHFKISEPLQATNELLTIKALLFKENLCYM